MSSIYITIGIIAFIGLLACYAFISQTLEKKRQQKQRLLAALKARARNFKYIITGFPTDFLPKELNVLVHRCLVEVCEQLAQLEPNDGSYLQDLQLYNAQMDELKRKPKPSKRVKLENAQQIKDVKRALEELHKFTVQLETRGRINESQLKAYGAQIKKLVLQISVDAYLINAKQSHTAGKLRLALHYYTLAKKLLVRENGDGAFNAQIEKMTVVITNITAELALDEPEYEATPDQAALNAEASEEWSSFDKSDADWKKKNVYD